MNRDSGSAQALALPAAQVEFALAQIENSAAFRTSPRHRALLRHMVAKVLADDLAALKETVIAVEVFGRPAASFDPRHDTIVRVEARRLRARLASYYRADGRSTPIRIELPVGSYVPLIAARGEPLHAPQATRRARDLVERGEHFVRQSLSKHTLEQALERFDRALRESPDFAPALVGMGRAWLNVATGWYQAPAIASAHAGEALRRALEIDPDHAVAHALLGAIQHQFERDWRAAQRSFERAIVLAPDQAFVHSAYGCHLRMHDAVDDAERELLLARRIDPHYINARTHMVNLRILQGRLDDAEAEIVAMQDISPGTVATLGLRGTIAMCRGDAAAAIEHYRRACETAPEYAGCFIALAGAYAMAGRTDEADALVAQTLASQGDAPLSPYVLAIFETRRARPDAAFALLERALRECDPLAVTIPGDPSFAGLHGHPRWAPLCAAAARPAVPAEPPQ